jgi:LacI family transcriptional regulator
MNSTDSVPLAQSRTTRSADGRASADVKPNKAENDNDSTAEQESRSNLVGIVINAFDSPFYGRVAEYASNYLMKHGCNAIVQSRSRTKISEMQAWLSLDVCDCDGFLIHPGTLTNNELLQLLERFPTSILINRYLPPYEKQCVYLDNFYGGYLAANFLLGLGHTRIAMVTGPKPYFDVQERTAGFENALAGNQPSLGVSLVIEGDFTIGSGAAALQEIVESSKRVTAVFFHNDDMALGALTQCKAMGINVPGDISIIGYDDEQLCRHTTPQLTSIRQPLQQVGETAAQLMLQMLNDDQLSDNDKPQKIEYKPELVERDSVKQLNSVRYSTLLTKREIECLEWIAIGKTTADVSTLLEIAESTITFHLRNAIEKLDSKNRSHAVNIALKKGVITGNYEEHFGDDATHER